MQSSKPSIAKKDQQSTNNKGQTDLSNLAEDSKDMTVSNVKLKTRSKSVVKAGTLKSRTDPKELAKVQILEKPEVKKVVANKESKYFGPGNYYLGMGYFKEKNYKDAL